MAGQILGQNFLGAIRRDEFFSRDLVGRYLAIFSVRIFFLHFSLEFDTLAVRKKRQKARYLVCQSFRQMHLIKL